MTIVEKNVKLYLVHEGNEISQQKRCTGKIVINV